MTGPARRPEIHCVDPARLAFGRWDTEQNVQAGEGDIVGSYSADRIGMGQPIRRPFRFRNELWVCTGITGGAGQTMAEAYRLSDPAVFEEGTTTYSEKTRDPEAARRDPSGFYHGMAVHAGKRSLILVGPPVVFVRGRDFQTDLFTGLGSGSRDPTSRTPEACSSSGDPTSQAPGGASSTGS